MQTKKIPIVHIVGSFDTEDCDCVKKMKKKQQKKEAKKG